MAGGKLITAQEHVGFRAVRVALSISAVYFCIFFISVLLLLLFTSFAVLLNCPHPNP